jgi:transcriptional regulator with XRE-family HTH domain
MNEADLLNELGKRIRHRRQELGWIQQELAEKTGMHRTYVADLERGARNVSINNLIRLGQALQTSASDLCRDICPAG